MGQSDGGTARGIDVRGVSKVFDVGLAEVRALDDVSVHIRENEFFTLLGPSGCGKTTLLRLIAGFESASDGEILLDGAPLTHLPPFRRPVNTVFQSYALFPHMSVAKNIAFGLEMLGKPKDEIEWTVNEMLQLVRMEALRDRATAKISGGQQQRVALARALAPQPKVLLLDEPLSALDLKLRKEMQIELKRLQKNTGITFVFVTHDQEEALTMSDRVAVMNQGKILQIGTPRDIYDRPSDRFVADFIGETNFLDAEVVSADGGRAQVRLAAGAAIAAALPEGGARAGKVTIVIRPEHARLAEKDARGALPGQLENIVYFGTDTHYQVRLQGGALFTVRMQNTRGNAETFRTNSEVGVLIAEDAAQVLRN
jgi:spermidine/putrescine transport system ATP-binding protein